MNKEVSVCAFSVWLDKLFRLGKVNNISQTQHWIRVFLREVNTKGELNEK